MICQFLQDGSKLNKHTCFFEPDAACSLPTCDLCSGGHAPINAKKKSYQSVAASLNRWQVVRQGIRAMI